MIQVLKSLVVGRSNASLMSDVLYVGPRLGPDLDNLEVINGNDILHREDARLDKVADKIIASRKLPHTVQFRRKGGPLGVNIIREVKYRCTFSARFIAAELLIYPLKSV